MKDLKGYLKQVQALCEFSYKTDPTGIDLEHIFQVMEEVKIGEAWDDKDLKQYQEAVYYSLRFLARNLYRPNHTLEIEPPSGAHKVFYQDDKLRLITRVTSGPNDYVKVHVIDESLKKYKIKKDDREYYMSKIEYDGLLPFLVYRAIELLTRLPPNTLRFCKANDCNNTFATLHKTKAYCSPRCRNRMGVYAARRKQKDSQQ